MTSIFEKMENFKNFIFLTALLDSSTTLVMIFKYGLSIEVNPIAKFLITSGLYPIAVILAVLFLRGILTRNWVTSKEKIISWSIITLWFLIGVSNFVQIWI